MSFSRQPGIAGLWEHPFPAGELPRRGGKLAHLPTGSAIDALSTLGIIGMTTPEAIEAADAAAITPPEPPSRYRIVKFNGYFIKVQDVPQWLRKAKAMIAGGLTADKVDQLLPLLWRQRAETRGEAAQEILAHIQSTNQPDVAGAFEAMLDKRMAGWRESLQQPEEELEPEQAEERIMPTWTQQFREMAIGVPEALGEDKLLLKSFKLTEEISRPFVCECTMYSEDTEIDFNLMVGENVTLRLDYGNESGGVRYVNGYVSRFVQGGHDRGDSPHQYYATIVPWLWLLTRASDCKIYQAKTIPDIVKEVFGDFGCSELVELNLTGTYPEHEYIVQYRETAFNFVSRLLEHEGIYYYFKHENGKHTLVLADSPSAHVEVESYEDIPYHDGANQSGQGVSEWSVEMQMMPGKHALADYDFKVPTKDLTVQKILKGEHPLAESPLFDYPGGYINKADGETRAESRIQELMMHHVLVKARGNSRGLTVGCKFTLSGAARADQDGEYVITAFNCVADHDATSSGQEELFQCQFTCVKADTQIRPRRVTPKPLITGPQTAIVTTSSGSEEILVDEFGRVKVHFHWDRWNPFDDTSSCWIRVAQVWAGKAWGAIFTPRKDQEVIVEFLEGDPDQPIITGRVYNGANGPPYALPGSKNVSGVKSNTTTGGGGYNEFSFDDTAGSEVITIHAQKDMNTTVENDQSDTVHNNRTITVEGTHTETITKDTTIKVTEGKLVDRVETGTAEYYVKDAVTEIFDATQTTTVKQAITTQSTDASIEVHGKTQVLIHTGDATTINMLEAGKIAINATDTLQLSCGDCVIELKKDGTLKISAKKIEVSGAQEAKLGVGNQNITCDVSKVAIGGAAINSSAVGMHEIAGAVVKIN